MRQTLRRLTGRCARCGQHLNGYKNLDDKIRDINARAMHLTEVLGRRPSAQNCRLCNRIVFEGEPGFVQRYLLVDILD